MTRFCRFELRTRDVEAARAFYTAVLGAGSRDITPLPEQAAARGAPPHWLGYIGVDDVERTASAFVERGASRLGPTRPAADGGEVAILRDPGGAVLALSTRSSDGGCDDVVWHVLNTSDVERALANYGELFGWHLTGRLDLGSVGVYHEFAWRPGRASVGAMVDVAGRPGVHPHWLFHSGVAALEPALVEVRAGGGAAIGPIVLPGGERIAVCDDPQGAAFALLERPPR